MASFQFLLWSTWDVRTNVTTWQARCLTPVSFSTVDVTTGEDLDTPGMLPDTVVGSSEAEVRKLLAEDIQKHYRRLAGPHAVVQSMEVPVQTFPSAKVLEEHGNRGGGALHAVPPVNEEEIQSAIQTLRKIRELANDRDRFVADGPLAFARALVWIDEHFEKWPRLQTWPVTANEMMAGVRALRLFPAAEPSSAPPNPAGLPKVDPTDEGGTGGYRDFGEAFVECEIEPFGAYVGQWRCDCHHVTFVADETHETPVQCPCGKEYVRGRKEALAGAGDFQKMGRDLLKVCVDFVIDNDITCGEAIYQTDRVVENSLPFIEKVCDLVGYKKLEEDEEDEDDED